MNSIEAMKKALEALEVIEPNTFPDSDAEIYCRNAIATLRQSIAEAEPSRSDIKQEPVALYGYCPECGGEGMARERRPNGNDCCVNGHTYPSRTALPAPQRQWVGLTDEQKVALCKQFPDNLTFNSINAVEAKLKAKNSL